MNNRRLYSLKVKRVVFKQALGISLELVSLSIHGNSLHVAPCVRVFYYTVSLVPVLYQHGHIQTQAPFAIFDLHPKTFKQSHKQLQNIYANHCGYVLRHGNFVSCSFKSNTLERSNMLSFLVQLVVIGLRHDPLPEVGVGRILDWHEAVADLRLEFKQFLKSYAPNGCHISLACPQLESNTLELSHAFGCHGTWLTVLIQPVVRSLIRSPGPKLGVDRILA